MSLKKVFAGVAAASFAVSALAVSSFAAEAKVEPITLDASEATGAKMVQWDINLFGDKAIETMEITGKIGGAFGDTGLYQGGWGFGMNDSNGNWFQPSDPQIAIDLENNVLDQSVHFEHPRQGYTIDAEVDDEGNLSIKYDFTPMGADAPVPAAGTDGIAQFGWWWGSDGTADGSAGTFTLTDVIVNNVSLVTGETVGADETPETEAPETEAPAGDDQNQVGDTDGEGQGDGNDTQVGDSNNNPGTGVGVAVLPAVLAAGALAATAVIRKRK